MVGPGEVEGGIGKKRGQPVKGHPDGDGVGVVVCAGRPRRRGRTRAMPCTSTSRAARPWPLSRVDPVGGDCGPLGGRKGPVTAGVLGGIAQVGAAPGEEPVDRVG